MKVCIVNLPFDVNYGGSLQRYALCKALESLGHDVEVLNYFPKRTALRILKDFAKRFFAIYNGKKPKVLVTQLPQFMDFWEENYKLTKEKTSRTIPQSVIARNDVFIVGSDQVWRYQFMKFNLPLYCLSGVPKDKIKIAYAASMGISDGGFPEEEGDRFFNNVADFKAVSVREKSSQAYLQKKYELNVEQLLDPTLLFPADSYRKMMSLSSQNEGYLFTYVLDDNEQLKKIRANVADKYNLSLKSVSITPDKDMISPVDWVRNYCNASYVITDSYHGTVFSIIFNVPFVCVINKARGADRFYSLLSSLNLENRILDNNVDDLITTEINWDEVNSKIDVLRVQAFHFLKENLKK